jgi:hypothetical protein
MPSPRDLFAPIVSPSRHHPQFAELLGSHVHRDARALMNALYERMGDPNGNFAVDFQSVGFHARVFELACFAYLEEARLTIDRSYERPDFLASGGRCEIAIEAVTANPSGGQGVDVSLRRMVPLTQSEIFEKVSREFPQRLGNSLHKKLRKNYHDLAQCKDKPLVFMIAPYFEGGSNFYTDDALVHPLFGAPEGAPEETEPFFQRPDADVVSAVLYCNQFTVSRFFRMATDFRVNGPPTTRGGHFYRQVDDDHTVLDTFEHRLGASGLPPETWSQGVTVFENPNARVPLPRGALPATCFAHVKDGFVTREVGDFHPILSFMIIHGD